MVSPLFHRPRAMRVCLDGGTTLRVLRATDWTPDVRFAGRRSVPGCSSGLSATLALSELTESTPAMSESARVVAGSDQPPSPQSLTLAAC